MVFKMTSVGIRSRLNFTTPDPIIYLTDFIQLNLIIV